MTSIVKLFRCRQKCLQWLYTSGTKIVLIRVDRVQIQEKDMQINETAYTEKKTTTKA